MGVGRGWTMLPYSYLVRWREHEIVLSYSGAFWLDDGQEREIWKLMLVETILGNLFNVPFKWQQAWILSAG